MKLCQCLLVLSLIVSCVSSTAQAQDDRFAAIPKRMEEFIITNRITGAVTLVGQNGKVVNLSAVGMANLAEKRPMSADTVFRIMSMTKPMTATALMTLQDEGKLSVDDPVEKYIPSFKNAMHKDGSQIRNLTIRRLLTHTSGLGGDQNCPFSLEATAEMLAQRSFDFQPGERWQYGPSLNVCARIIEIVSGKNYDEFMAERIFKPLEMNDTTFFPKPEQVARLAVVYKPGPKEGPAMVSPWRLRGANLDEKVPGPSGGLFSTAGDIFRFYQTILDGGEWKSAPGGPRRIVSAAAVKEMTSNQTGELRTNWGASNSWGLGWCLIHQPRGASGDLSPGSFGHGGLYGTQVWCDPSKQAVYVLMIQSIDFEDSDSSPQGVSTPGRGRPGRRGYAKPLMGWRNYRSQIRRFYCAQRTKLGLAAFEPGPDDLGRFPPTRASLALELAAA